MCSISQTVFSETELKAPEEDGPFANRQQCPGGRSLPCFPLVLRPATEAQATHMQRIVVLNPKGGSGKTTVAINLAS